MKKSLWLAILLVATIGIVLMISGFMFGAETNLYIDRGGLHMGSSDLEHIVENNIGEINEIEIDMSSGNIEILPAGDYSFEIYRRDNSSISYSFSGGKLYVKQNLTLSWRLFDFGLGHKTEKVIVYLPESALLRSADLKISSGRIDASSIDCQNLNLKISSGTAHINNVISNEATAKVSSGNVKISGIEAKNLQIEITSGSLKADDVKSQGFSARVSSGTVNLSGKFLGDSDVRVTSGTVNMEIDGAEKDYRRIFSVSSGSVYVNGKRNPGSDSNTGANNSLNVKVSSGTVRVNFSR